MRRLKRIVLLLSVLLVAGTGRNVAAEENHTPTALAALSQGEPGKAGLTLYPSEEMVQNAVTTLRITIQISAPEGMVGQVQTSFDPGLPDKVNIQAGNYQADTGLLNLYISGYETLFQEGVRQVKLADIVLTPKADFLQAELALTDISYVDQSHIQTDLSKEDLGEIRCLVEAGEKTPDPEDKPGTDPENKPGTGETLEAETTKVVSSYEEVQKALEDTSITEIRLAVEEGFVLSAEEQEAIFTKLQGTERSFAIQFWKNGRMLYSFRFEGTRITDPKAEVKFGLQTGGERRDVLSLAQKDAGNLALEFQHEGALPGPCEVKVFLGDTFQDGECLFLYYYNPKEKLLELWQKDAIVVDGCGSFEFEHCSDYLLTNQQVKESSVYQPGTAAKDSGNAAGKNQSAAGAKTGDSMKLAGSIGLLVLSMAGALLLVKKRKRA